ncbi:MAG: NRDE family protein [Gemmatimonadales bacterium]
MCTLSWLPAAEGYRLFFNRDERLTRAPGRPPEPGVERGVRFLAPVDGDAGGTWIGVNEYGLAVALLNRYPSGAPGEHPWAGPRGRPANRISRGILVRALLGCRDRAAAVRYLKTAELHRYEPFTAAFAGSPSTPRVAAGRARPTGRDAGSRSRGKWPPLTIADWDRRRLVLEVHSAPGLVRTSSGHDQVAAARHRTARFEEMLAAGPPSVERLRAFHRDHTPARGALSVCMHRDDAATQSYSEILVTPRTATIVHRGGPPCRARTGRPTLRRLRRRRAGRSGQ